jgi:hypothetical protein
MFHMNPSLLNPDFTALTVSAAAVDLSDLSGEDVVRLRMCVSEFRSSGRRLIGELYVMTQQLCFMRDILGDRFRAYVESELDLAPRMISRYMHINKVLNTHFTVDGHIASDVANAFTQRALALLSPTTDTDVVLELRELASQGKSIDHKVVMEAMNRSEADAVAQLASAQADLTAKTRQLADLQQQREVERARTQRETESQSEMLRRGEQRRKDLEDEIEKLRAQETEVRYEPREVVPAGYASVEEAISAKTRELATLATELTAVSTEIETLTEQRTKLQEVLEQTNAGSAQFLAMKEQADSLIAQFPIALLKSLSEKDATVNAAIASLGETFVLFGQQLTKAGAQKS